MSLLSDVKRIGPEEALTLETRAKAGDPQALIRFTQYAVWRKLVHDRAIPAKEKPMLFNAIITTIPIIPEVTHG